MIRVLGEHAAHKVVEQGWKPFRAHDGQVIAKLELPMHDGSVVKPVHWHPAQSQCRHQNAQGVDVVGDAAVAARGGMAERAIGGLEHRRLMRGWRGPCGAEGHRAIGLTEEHVVGSDRAMGLPAHVQLFQYRGDRAQHEFDHHRFRPCMQPMR